jgi:hypothetical protein
MFLDNQDILFKVHLPITNVKFILEDVDREGIEVQGKV